MDRYTLLAATILSLPLLTGCASSGAFNTANFTEVQLAEDNFEIVAANVRGEASAGYLLGISSGFYGQMQTAALARVSGSGMIYGEAVADLWKNFEAEFGAAEGRNLALVNVRFDAEALNLLIYTQPRVSVRADVVEFTD